MTIKDLARIAGVSHSTVSRSLNNSPLISEKTKTKIKKLAEKHHFDLNASARSLSTRKTDTIGVVLPAHYEDRGYLQYLGALMNSIRYSLEKSSFDAIITFPKNAISGEDNIRKLVKRRKVDGLLLVIPDIEQDVVDFCLDRSVPLVILHFKQDKIDTSGVDYIYTDHETGGYMATSHLIAGNRKRIITLTEDRKLFEYGERTSGYRRALIGNSLPVNQEWIIEGKCSVDFGYSFTKENADLFRNIDAVFAQSDFIAVGVIEALKELKISVPDSIAVIGYDDLDIGTYFKPNLSTVHQPKENFAALACERLIDKICMCADEPSVHMVIEPQLIIRDSCGRKHG